VGTWLRERVLIRGFVNAKRPRCASKNASMAARLGPEPRASVYEVSNAVLQQTHVRRLLRINHETMQPITGAVFIQASSFGIFVAS